MYGQLSNRESLHMLIVALEAHSRKLYHLGMGKSVTLSNLSKANERLDYRIFEEFAFFMIGQTRCKRQTGIFKLGGNVYAFDSTTIDLCLSVFEWAKFRSRKGGIKCTLCTILRPKCLPSCILHLLWLTIPRQCRKYRMSLMHTISSTVVTTILPTYTR